jgi:SAM-dependent methyltransferase
MANHSHTNQNIREHFIKTSKKYQEVVHNANSQMYANIRERLNKELKGVVLDIGNGNVFNYDLERIESLIAYDLSFQNVQDSDKVKYITGDARQLVDIKTHSCDRVVLQFLLHHIVDSKKDVTNASAQRCLQECWRVLNSNGELIIVEMIIHPISESVQMFFYEHVFKFLSWMNKPMTRFYSRKRLKTMFAAAGFRGTDFSRVNIGKWIDPFEALFPGVVKIPSVLYPAACQFITAKKA